MIDKDLTEILRKLTAEERDAVIDFLLTGGEPPPRDKSPDQDDPHPDKQKTDDSDD